MKVFRNLEIAADPQRLGEFVELVLHGLRDPWSLARDKAQESLARDFRPTARWCARRAWNGPFSAVLLWLRQMDENRVEVTNIVPDAASGQLSLDEYNTIVEEFYRAYVAPLAVQQSVAASLSKSEETLEDWMSPQTATLLRRYLSLANLSSPLAHPNDEQRWEDFIVAAHNEQSSLDGHTLRRWLCEDQRLPDVIAMELVSKYEFGRSLLSRALIAV